MLSKRKLRSVRSLLLGLAVMLLFAGALELAFHATSGLPAQHHTYVKAAFADVGGLRVDDDVRIARVRVGRVSAVTFDNGVPTVTLQIDGDYPIYRNGKASVADRSALGQKLVDVQPGTADAGRLGPSEVIPLPQTTSSQNLGDLFDVFDPKTRQALGSTIRETGNGLGGHATDLHDALQSSPGELADLGTISDALSADQGQNLVALLNSANKLSTRFAGRERQLTDLVGQLDTTLRAVNVDGGKPLADTLNRSPETLRTARGALRSLQAPLADTQAAMQKLQPGATALAAATPDLRGVLREGVGPLNKLPAVDRQATPALDDLTKVVSDARPVAPRAAQALASADPLVNVLAPYAPEIGLFFDNWASALAHGDQGGRYLRVTLMLNTESVDGQLGMRDPFVARDPYPAPGQAGNDSKGSLSPIKGR